MKNNANNSLTIDAGIVDASGVHHETRTIEDAKFDYITGCTYIDFMDGSGRVKIEKIVVEDDYEQWENYYLKSEIYHTGAFNSALN